VIILPIGNSNTTSRTPWVTISIISLNVLIFLFSCVYANQDEARLEKSAQSLYQYLQNHPELIDQQRVGEVRAIAGFSEDRIASLQRLASGHNADLDRYAYEYSQYKALLSDVVNQTKDSFYVNYGYVPNHPSIVGLFTSMFVHGGIFHLLFNMFFFFAVAYSLEDLWGSWFFAGFYLVSGIAATLVHHAVFSSSNVPVIGASGAIAGVMGAYLIRLFNTKIKVFLWGRWRVILRLDRIVWIPAYIFLPIWFLLECLAAAFPGESDVAHWVHIGGFAFGMCFAFGVKLTNLESRFANTSIESRFNFAGSSAVTKALACLEKGDTERASSMLDAHLIKNPTDVDALLAIVQVCQAKNDLEGTRRAYARVIRQYLRMNKNDLALSTYDSLLSTYTEANPALPLTMREWMAICDHLEKSGMHEVAAIEYRRAGRALSSDPYAAKALITSGEIFLDKVGNNKEAAHSFVEAKNLKPAQSQWVERIIAGVNKIKELETARIKGNKKPEENPINPPSTSSQPERSIPPGGLSF